MCTFKQAVKASKEYLDTDLAQSLLKVVEASITHPSYRQIIEAVDDVYRMFYHSLAFEGALYTSCYKKREKLNDDMFLPDWIGERIIKTLVLFYFCKDFRNPKLKDLRVLITELINLYESYVLAENVTAEEYNDMIKLDI